MNIALKNIDRAEVLRYLGQGQGTVDELVAAQLLAAEEVVLTLARPRAVYRLFDLAREGETLSLLGTALTLLGRDIRTHLATADRCLLFAATLGAAVDQEILRVQTRDMALAAVMDATASAAIEQVCALVQHELTALAASVEGHLTDRFSPGYGDMPLEQQRAFCTVLDGEKIGLGVTDHFLLTPRKSVTAILGLCPRPLPLAEDRSSVCTLCHSTDTCNFRKAGAPCGKPLS